MHGPRPLPWPLAIALVAFLAFNAPADDRPDRTVADFEGGDYLPWIADGTAFGAGPARGTLPGQMAVEGFEGQGLVNSFRGGDDSTGTLTSPPIVVDRKFLNFLIGGGKYPGETCLELLIDGVVTRSATGPNDKPGGSERLDWASWDLTDLAGKSVVLRIVDHRQGSWGHINVDQIVLSDRPRGSVEQTVEVPITSRYLHLPIHNQAPIRRVKVTDSAGSTREFDIKLAEGAADFATFLDLLPFRGKSLRIETRLPVDSKALAGITQANSIPEAASLYREPGRPQIHFTSRRGWLNDPNGLVFFDGEYHLFYQHNPYGWDWGNMHWGHAVSPDLVHWTELPIAISPHEYGDMAFSGSAVVDRSNSSKFGDGSIPPLVAAYTSTGRGECIAYSQDRGRTWTEFAGNPVVKHAGRDPKLIWHKPSKRWVMAVYDEEGGQRDVAFYSSPDLKAWTFESRIGGFFECPDLFELPVAGSPGLTRWVLTAADGAYLLGQFDGKTFTPESTEKQKVWHGHFYAAQTFSDEPQGRRVQIGWAQGISFPGQPFNQQMNIPCELTLRKTDQGVRLFANPVAEVEKLRKNSRTRSRASSSGGGNVVLKPTVGELYDLKLVAEVGSSIELKLILPGATLTYDPAAKVVEVNGIKAPLEPITGKITLRIVGDRGSVEVFGNDGLVAISASLKARPDDDQTATAVLSGEGPRSMTMEVELLKSSWK